MKKGQIDFEMLQDLHYQASFTVKMLTYDMVEGKAPICYLIQQHQKVSKESVMFLLYRCERLYEVKNEATKLL